jgi:cation transport protein ChaC
MAGAGVSDFFPKLWEREMSTGAYLPRWLRCTTDQGDVTALVFIMNRENPAYISALPREELLAVVRRATGKYGACTEYVLETHRALMDAGICDRQLASVAADLASQAHVPGED